MSHDGSVDKKEANLFAKIGHRKINLRDFGINCSLKKKKKVAFKNGRYLSLSLSLYIHIGGVVII